MNFDVRWRDEVKVDCIADFIHGKLAYAGWRKTEESQIADASRIACAVDCFEADEGLTCEGLRGFPGIQSA